MVAARRDWKVPGTLEPTDAINSVPLELRSTAIGGFSPGGAGPNGVFAALGCACPQTPHYDRGPLLVEQAAAFKRPTAFLIISPSAGAVSRTSFLRVLSSTASRVFLFSPHFSVHLRPF